MNNKRKTGIGLTKKLLKIAGALLGLGIIVGLIGVSIFAYFSFGLPKIASLSDYRPALSSQILSEDGEVLAEIGHEKREVANLSEIPKIIIDAFLSAEDDSFYDHTGVDYLGVLRALLVNIKAGKVVQGGSTITQQVAKSLLLTKERSVTRKIKDFLLAQKIEKKFSKQDILFLYLNQVYLGGGYYGVKAAFKGYFGKELAEATIAESAMIAGLLVAPGKYSPYVNPEFAIKRQRYVLKRMESTGKITKENLEAATKEVIKIRTKRNADFKAGYFTDWVRQRVIEQVGEDKFLRDGFTVVTTLDWELQKVAEKEVMAGIREIDKRQGFKGPNGAIDLAQNLETNEVDFRKNVLGNESQYFTINGSFNKVLELEFDQQLYKQAVEKRNLQAHTGSQRFVPGFIKSDNFTKYLKENEFYDAVTVGVDDTARIITASLGGIPCLIPYDEFKWADEREIQEEKKFFAYLTQPSKILKQGDLITVKIISKSTDLLSSVDQNSKSVAGQIKADAWLKSQKYFSCSLEQKPEVQGALVSMDPQTGKIKSFVGGTDFIQSQFNRAIQAKRQPGSSFKPFLYAAGLENNYTPSTIIIDSPEALGGVDDNLNWKPKNYDGEFKGPVTFRNSLEQSRNVPTIKIANRIGVVKIHEFLQRIGFNAKLESDLSLALGSFGVTLLDIVTSYAIFPNGGKKTLPKAIISIMDRDRNVYQVDEAQTTNPDSESANTPAEAKTTATAGAVPTTSTENNIGQIGVINQFIASLSGNQVYDSRLAFIMTSLLKGVIQNGTGANAKDLGPNIAGKTGTTSNYVDAWFLGYSSNLVTGVWTGFDDNKTLGYGETGARSALPIWKEYMKSGLKKLGESDFGAPLGIVHVSVDKETGKLAETGQKGSFMEVFVENTEPGSDANSQFDEANPTENNTILEDDDYYENQ